MTKCIAFHSYKDGTGKTTIAANLAVLLARKGYQVFLIELYVYAPSLHAYFEKKSIKWLNDFLWSNAEADDVRSCNLKVTRAEHIEKYMTNNYLI